MKTRLQLLSLLLNTLLLMAGSLNAADFVWIANGGGDWNAPGDWSPPQVPGPTDNAFITNNGTYIVTMGANNAVGTVTLGGSSGTQTLSVGKAILTLNGASVVNANGQFELTVAGSTLTGAGDLNVFGTLLWSGGTMSGTGVTSIGGGGVLTINGNATLTGRTLNNGGTGTWDAGNITAGSSAVFNNLAGATFDITFDGHASVATAPATFSNAGLFRKTAGTVSTIIGPQFNNSGAVEVHTGTVSLGGGGTHTGNFNNSAGATLEFGGGNHVLAVGSLVTGAGTVNVSGGTLTANGTFDVTGSTLGVTAGVATL